MTTLAQDIPQDNRRAAAADLNTVIVAEWPLKRHERLRITLELFNGVWLINSRKWFETENGEWRPSKQGIALGVKHLPQLADAVAKALSIARERGLIAVDGEAAK
jgi:hypothetical protein